MDVGPILAFLFVIVLVESVISACICAVMASRRGRSTVRWGIIGFIAAAVLGPFGIGIAVIALSNRPSLKRLVPYCPRCTQPLPYPVPACPRCGQSFVPLHP